MDRFEAMRTLVAAVDGGSLSAASRALGVPLPTVSRRVSDLETYLQNRLVIRTSRKLLLTDAGRAYVATCRRILDDLDDAERAATGEYRTPRGDMVITAPVMFGRLHVEPVVLDFLKFYPEINVRLILADYFIDLTESHVDLAVRIGLLPDSSLVAKKLGTMHWITCASPAYLAAQGTPQILADLARHECIAFEGLYSTNTWAFKNGKDTVSVPIRPRFSVNTANGAIDAALNGAGIARVLSYQAAAWIGDGQLFTVLDDYRPDPIPIHAIHTAQPLLPIKLRAFLDFLTPRLKHRLSATDM
jgi:DNA-binding transcriptional LysR family regulator